MDVIFEPQNGDSFTIEIGYFDTVLEIKEKVEKYKEIPVSNQTLIFNGKILEDTGDVDSCVILNDSRIQLLEKSKSPEKLKVKTEDQFHPLTQNSQKLTKLILKFPSSKSHVHQKFSIDVDLNDSVEQLKEKLFQIEGFPNRPLVLYVNRNIELQDQKQLSEYELTDGSEIDVMMRPSSAPTSPATTNTVPTTSSKKLKVMVLTKCGTKRLVMEVNPMDKVQVLRSELEKLQQRVNFQLPSEGYFFIYKQNVMEERETFQWHNVRQNDTIEIFNGSVTGGS